MTSGEYVDEDGVIQSPFKDEVTTESIIDANVHLDLSRISQTIIKANDLNDSDELFGALAEIQIAKEAFKAEQEKLDAAERLVKQTINDRAKALYGEHWDAIKGQKYKITRSYTGAVYVVDGEPPLELCKLAIDSEKVEKYLEENNALPDGVSYNPKRGEMIRITVKQ